MGGWLAGIVHVSTTTNGQNNECLIIMVISETRKRERERVNDRVETVLFFYR